MRNKYYSLSGLGSQRAIEQVDTSEIQAPEEFVSPKETDIAAQAQLTYENLVAAAVPPAVAGDIVGAAITQANVGMETSQHTEAFQAVVDLVQAGTTIEQASNTVSTALDVSHAAAESGFNEQTAFNALVDIVATNPSVPPSSAQTIVEHAIAASTVAAAAGQNPQQAFDTVITYATNPVVKDMVDANATAAMEAAAKQAAEAVAQQSIQQGIAEGKLPEGTTLVKNWIAGYDNKTVLIGGGILLAGLAWILWPKQNKS